LHGGRSMAGNKKAIPADFKNPLGSLEFECSKNGIKCQ